MSSDHPRTRRQPRVALLEHVQLIEAPAQETVAPAIQDAPLSITKPRLGLRIGKLFWIAFTGLIGLAIGLWLDGLIANLFQRADWLGYLGLVLTFAMIIAIVVFALREVIAIARLTKIQTLQERAQHAFDVQNLEQSRLLTKSLLQLYEQEPQTAKARANLHVELSAIHDPKDLLLLCERLLLEPLDKQATQIIMQSAKRISVVTAISPRALIDVLFVGYENLRLMRRLFLLYGGRPGAIGLVRIARQTIANIAISGGLSATDGIVQSIFGHGLAAKVSSRLGEGVINGMLTARIGRSAMIECRPMPFLQTKPPSMKAMLSELSNSSSVEENP